MANFASPPWQSTQPRLTAEDRCIDGASDFAWQVRQLPLLASAWAVVCWKGAEAVAMRL
jgi:hypothetical protein